MTSLRTVASALLLLVSFWPADARADTAILTRAQATRSFASFAETWMERARAGGAPVWRFSTSYRVEVEETGDPELPYLGVLHYERSKYGCPNGRPGACRLLHTRPMRHLFPYANGRWQF